MPSLVTIPAFAKLNLALAVAPPEPPVLADGQPNPRAGWHPICSLFCCIDLVDELTLALRPTGMSRFAVRWAKNAPRISEIDWPIERDLIVRAHAILEARAGRSLPVDATLTKRIPVGGGMGGGSSDAAAMLRGLTEIFDLDPAHALAAAPKLGSDVPFFLDAERDRDSPARPALVEGFGERLTRRGPLRGHVVLIIPEVSCPTPAVYRAFDALLADRGGRRFRAPEVRGLFAADSQLDSGALFNDLAEPAFSVAPGLREIHAAASSRLSPLHVTGSGSTLFAIAGEAPTPRQIAEIHARLGTVASVLATRLV